MKYESQYASSLNDLYQSLANKFNQDYEKHQFKMPPPSFFIARGNNIILCLSVCAMGRLYFQYFQMFVEKKWTIYGLYHVMLMTQEKLMNKLFK